MKVPADLVPQKVVADDLCVSLATLWRARRSNLPGFPAPVILRNMVFWRRADLAKLEDALMQFQGRGKFEQERERSKRIAAMTTARPQPKRIKRRRRPDERQRDLF
jgi:hypothetical protein